MIIEFKQAESKRRIGNERPSEGLIMMGLVAAFALALPIHVISEVYKSLHSKTPELKGSSRITSTGTRLTRIK